MERERVYREREWVQGAAVFRVRCGVAGARVASLRCPKREVETRV